VKIEKENKIMKNIVKFVMTGVVGCALCVVPVGAEDADNADSTATTETTASESAVVPDIETAVNNFYNAHKDEGFTLEKDAQGRSIVKDPKGNPVPIQAILPPPLPPKEVMEKAMDRFLEVNKDKGFTKATDDQGRTVIKDASGNIVPLQAFLPPPPPPPPSKEDVEKAMDRFLEVNKDKGFTKATDDQGRTVIKDASGNIVPLHAILPPHPQVIHNAIIEYYEANKANGYTMAKDEQGRIIVKDASGNVVPLKTILDAANGATASETATVSTDSSSDSSTTSSGTVETTETSTEDADNPDSAIEEGDSETTE
jgi:hypothetical protein